MPQVCDPLGLHIVAVKRDEASEFINKMAAAPEFHVFVSSPTCGAPVQLTVVESGGVVLRRCSSDRWRDLLAQRALSRYRARNFLHIHHANFDVTNDETWRMMTSLAAHCGHLYMSLEHVHGRAHGCGLPDAMTMGRMFGAVNPPTDVTFTYDGSDADAGHADRGATLCASQWAASHRVTPYIEAHAKDSEPTSLEIVAAALVMCADRKRKGLPASFTTYGK